MGTHKRIRPDEIAQETGIGRDTVYAMLRKGVIPSIKFGQQYIVSRQAFQRWWGELGSRQSNGVVQ